MSDYQGENPFDEPGHENYTSPPPVQPSYVAPPQVPPKSAPSVNRDHRPVDPALLARAEKLRQKEEELNKREEMLDKREAILWDREKNLDIRIPNWPRCRPLLYHNINEDIAPPEERPGLQRHVRWNYYLWLYGLTTAFIWSSIALLARLAVDSKGAAFADFFLSLLYLLFLHPLFFGIYRLLYRAARKEKAHLYVFFFIFFCFQILVEIFFAIGIPSTGGAGFINAIEGFDEDVAVGAMIFVAFGFWAIIVGLHIFLLIRTRKFYVQAGGNEKAKEGMRDAAIEEAKKHPDLMKKAAQEGVKVAAENPDLVVQGARTLS